MPATGAEVVVDIVGKLGEEPDAPDAGADPGELDPGIPAERAAPSPARSPIEETRRVMVTSATPRYAQRRSVIASAPIIEPYLTPCERRNLERRG